MANDKKYDLIIAGGGASGLYAARKAAAAGLRVLVLEKKERTGKKILITGNGRCNVSSLSVSAGSYPAPMREFTAPALDALPVQALMQEFASIGVPLKARGEYLYPRSDQASSVADALMLSALEAGAEICTESAVTQVRRNSRGFLVFTENDSTPLAAETVLLACGSKAAPKTGSDGSGYALAKSLGLPVRTVLPALTSLICAEPLSKVWAGVRTSCSVTVTCGNMKAEDTGEIQLTSSGISGIPVFQVSRLAVQSLAAGRKFQVSLNFLPDYDDVWLSKEAHRLVSGFGNRNIVQLLEGFFPKKLVQVFARKLDISEKAPVSELGAEAVSRIFRLAEAFPVRVTGYSDFLQAQVCQGGVAREAVDPETMMAQKIPGLFLAGELLDVDGPCGGFNLHWAWASGSLAAESAVRFVRGNKS